MITMDILPLPWIQEEQLSATGEKIERTQRQTTSIRIALEQCE